MLEGNRLHAFDDQYAVCCAGIAVPRLSNAPGVQDCAPSGQVSRDADVDLAAHRTAGSVLLHPQGNVTVPDKAQRPLHPLERRARRLISQEVLPQGVPQRAVDQRDGPEMMNWRERAQEEHRGLVHSSPRPPRGLLSRSVEGGEGERSHDSSVVVPEKGERAAARHPLQARHRLRPITNDVPETPDIFDIGGILQDCLERREVRVNVGEDRHAHFTAC